MDIANDICEIKKIDDCDAYRSVEAINKADERGIDGFHTITLEGWHKYVDELLQPVSELPVDIILQLETTKNIHLYSWYVYRFGVVGHNHMLSVLEFTLETKIKSAGNSPVNGLSRKLEFAISRGWFNDSCFSHIDTVDNSHEASKVICKAMVDIRNSLSHGSSFLYEPLGLVQKSRVCLDIINGLYKP